MDNVFIERLWRSLKWECVYLRKLETGSQATRRSEAGSASIMSSGRIRLLTVADPWTYTGEGHSASKAA